MITASSLARRLACPSSDALARAENASAAANAGRDEHADLSHLDALPDNLKRLVPPGAASEVKLAYDIATHLGRVIGYGVGRDYGTPGPCEIVGSADVIGVDVDEHGNRRAVVIDWKGGNEVEAATSNPQLLFYALAACRAMSLDSATVVIAYTKTGRVDCAEIGPLELAEFAERLGAMWIAVAARHGRKSRGEILDTSEGPWCIYCPSKHVCPSKNALLVQIGSGGLALVGDSTMTPERVVSAYRQLVSIEQLAFEARKRLVTFVDENGPIDLGDGLMYGRTNRKGNEELDGAIAIDAIREIVGESAREFEAIAIERSTTKAAIKRAAQAVAPTGGAAKLAESVIQGIRARGGVARKSSTRPIMEYRREGNDNVAVDTTEVNRLLGVV